MSLSIPSLSLPQPQHIRDAQRRADVWFDRYLKASAPTP